MPQVNCELSTARGVAFANLSDISWAWFDETDPTTFTAPTDQGQAETTNSLGSLSVSVPGSSLTAGQTGTLVLSSDDGSYWGMYNLVIGADAEQVVFSVLSMGASERIFSDPTAIALTACQLVLESPVHDNAGCIFDDPSEITVNLLVGGAWPKDVRRETVKFNDDEVVMAVIMKFLEVVDG